MTKGLISWLVGLSLAGSFGAAGCDGGFTNEEAVEVCQPLRDDLVNCVDDAAYLSCVACFEECGRECHLVDSTCPHGFKCQD